LYRKGKDKEEYCGKKIFVGVVVITNRENGSSCAQGSRKRERIMDPVNEDTIGFLLSLVVWGEQLRERGSETRNNSVGEFYSYGKIAAARYGFGQGHES